MSRKAERKTAVAYLRTSSAANVGANKDSEKRQRDAITAFAKRAGYEIVDWFSDAAVSGEDEIGDRPGFSAMLDRIEGNGVRVVLVEDASRFARKVLTQELGIVALQTRGVQRLCRDPARSDPSARRRRDRGQSLGPQERPRRKGAQGAGRLVLVPPAILARSEPNRDGVRQDQSAPAPRGYAHVRGALGRPGRHLRPVQPRRMLELLQRSRLCVRLNARRCRRSRQDGLSRSEACATSTRRRNDHG